MTGGSLETSGGLPGAPGTTEVPGCLSTPALTSGKHIDAASPVPFTDTDGGSEGPAAVSVDTVQGWILRLSSGASLAAVTGDSDAGLVDRLRVLEELKAAASAAQARAAAALDISVRRTHARAGLPREHHGRGVAAQVALARRESPARGNRILGFAKALDSEMPCTLRALSEGLISEWRATLLVRETACLSVEDRRLVDREVAGDPGGLEGLGDGRLIGRIRGITQRIDQEALVRLAAKAAADRYVSCRPAPDTMTYLTGLLPVAQGVAVFAALSREADSLRARGDERGRGQIMADTLVQRVTGLSQADRVPLEVQLVMTDRTLLAGSDEPAYLQGYGVVPAMWARDAVRKTRRGGNEVPGNGRAGTSSGSGGTPTGNGSGSVGDAGNRSVRSAGTGSGSGRGNAGLGPTPNAEYEGPAAADGGSVPPDLWLRRLYTAPESGELIGMDSKARFVPESLVRFISARDQTCRTPWCNAPIRHGDHIQPHRTGGTTDAGNLQGLCEACNQAKEAPGWRTANTGKAGRHTVRITTPTGHTYQSTAPPLPGVRAFESQG